MTHTASSVATALMSSRLYRTSLQRFAPMGTRRRHALRTAKIRLQYRTQDLLADAVWQAAALRRTAATRIWPPPPVAVSTSAAPTVSVVIAAYGKWAYTRRCLASIQANLPRTPIEVIVVDTDRGDRRGRRVPG